jgi:hypothetical protein
MENVKTIKAVVLITQGDCEGRSTKTIGTFIGTINQIITYCIKNNIEPYYNFSSYNANIIDVSSIKEEVNVIIREYGRIDYKTPEKLAKEAKRKEALSKLTDEEKRLLGL